jgi:glutaredoxin
MVKEFLSQKGIEFQERDISVNRAYAEEMMKATGQMGVPVTMIDGQTVIGFDRGRLEQILAQRQTNKRPSLGITIADAGKITAKTGMEIIIGAYIGSVKTNSTAEKLGLAAGDIITEFNLRPIATAADLEQALAKLSYGSRIALTIIRGDIKITKEGMF